MTTPQINAQIGQLLANNTFANNAPPATKTTSTSFFAALAQAWGQALDKAGQDIANESQNLNLDGQDTMSNITQLTADSTRMSFLANSSHTSLSESGDAMKAVAQK